MKTIFIAKHNERGFLTTINKRDGLAYWNPKAKKQQDYSCYDVKFKDDKTMDKFISDINKKYDCYYPD